MADVAKDFVVAPRRGDGVPPPDDWQRRLADIEGLTVSGGYGGRLQVTATAAALRAARQAFGDRLLFEEARPSRLAD
jgi:hypothetical protein